MSRSLEKLQRKLGYQFKNIELARLALTHRSYSGKNNERLEFLGDSIVNFIIANALYEKFPKAREGQLSRLRACLVKGETLAAIAKEMHLGDFLLLGLGEIKSGGHQRTSILADVIESLIGAIYCDSNMTTCQEKVLIWFQDRIDALTMNDKLNKDPKTRLQEWLQSQQRSLPRYELVEVTGQDHEQTFRVACLVEELQSVVGEGNSRRSAEQNAAEQILLIVGMEEKR